MYNYLLKNMCKDLYKGFYFLFFNKNMFKKINSKYMYAFK